MKYYSLILILLLNKIISSQEEKINFLNFGIINITSELFLDNAKWEVYLELKDTIISFEKNSSSNQKNLVFNINEKIGYSSILKVTPFVTIKKDGKLLYKQKTEFNFNNNSKYILSTKEIKNKDIKGEVIDSYEIQFESGIFYIIRSSIKQLYNYWYLIKDNKIINIHSEKNYNQPLCLGKIILTDLDEDQIPEISFFHKIDHKTKMIHFKKYQKLIAYKEKQKINIPVPLKKVEDLVYRGFFNHHLKNISE